MPNGLLARSASLIALLTIAGCASLLGPSEEERSTAAREVLEAYDVPGMLEQVAPIINKSLEANLPAPVPAARRERLSRVVTENYAPETLVGEATRRLRERADADERRGVLLEALQQLETPLAQDMIAREKKASTEEFAAGFEKFLEQPVEEADEPRLETARTLVERMGLVDLQVVFNVGMLRGMVTARNAVAPPGYRTSADSAERMAEQTENSLRERMDRQLPVMLFYAYRDAGDEELDRYAELQASPALSWANAAIPEVLAATLAEATGRLPGHFESPSETGNAVED